MIGCEVAFSGTGELCEVDDYVALCIQKCYMLLTMLRQKHCENLWVFSVGLDSHVPSSVDISQPWISSIDFPACIWQDSWRQCDVYQRMGISNSTQHTWLYFRWTSRWMRSEHSSADPFQRYHHFVVCYWCYSDDYHIAFRLYRTDDMTPSTRTMA